MPLAPQSAGKATAVRRNASQETDRVHIDSRRLLRKVVDDSRITLSRSRFRLVHAASPDLRTAVPSAVSFRFDVFCVVQQIIAGAMLGKRGVNPPLPRNCKRPYFGCTRPLPQKGGKAQPLSRGRKSGDRSRQAHSPLFPGRRGLHVRSKAVASSSAFTFVTVRCRAFHRLRRFAARAVHHPARQSCGFAG
jgi:hypothetical protein